MSGITDRALRADILRVLEAGVDALLDDSAFDALARRVFAYQFEHNAPYARYCERRARTPQSVAHWSGIPPVPTAAFKAVELVSGPAERAEAVFLTSGTTRGREQRGRHVVLDLEIYRRSALPNFRAHFLPDDAPLTFLCLSPRSAQQPDSSLAWMIDLVATQLGESADWFVDPDGGLDDARLVESLERAQRDARPVALVGTTLAFTHLLERLAHDGRRFKLPHGSRLMDTGGFKGSGRDVQPDDLLRAYDASLAIEATHRVNEYGMTEMCSQFYDTHLREHASGAAARAGHAVPPWVRSRVVDPDTLTPLEPGAVGILQHFDLANVGSVMAIQTEDLGVAEDGRFILLGRSPGAAPRGCSIAMDILLQDRPGR